MTTDDKVQGENPKGAVQETASVVEQPLTKEAVEKMVADAKKEATEETTRKMQSIKDREVAEVRRRFQSGGDSLTDIQEATRGLDQETQEKIELATLRAKQAKLSRQAQEEAAREEFVKIKNDFTDGLTSYLRDEEIDPSDKRIDWGKDDESLLLRQKKVLSSITKIKKQDAQKAEEKLKTKAKDLVNKERKDAGLDTVDTDISPASSPFKIENLGEMLNTKEGQQDLLKSGKAKEIIEQYRSGKLK
jgi:hypothetical protein